MRKQILFSILIFTAATVFSQTKQPKGWPKQLNPFTLKKNLHQRNSDSRELLSLPQNSVYYIWNSDNWENIYQNEYQYNDKGFLIQQIMKDPVTGENRQRLLNYYDQNNQDTLNLLQVWLNGNWTDNAKKINQYDQHGNIIFYLSETYEGNKWNILEGKKHELEYYENGLKKTDSYSEWNGFEWLKDTWDFYTYNENNQILVDSLLVFDEGNCMPSLKTIYHYNNIPPTPLCDTIEFQNWDGNSWEKSERLIDFVWKTTDTVFSYTDQQWVFQSYWEYNFRITNTFSSDSSISLEEFYNTFTLCWEMYSRETNFTDPKKNDLGYRYETWDGDAWQIENETKNTLTWDGDDITEKLVQYRDIDNPEYQNIEKYVYNNFLHLEVGIPFVSAETAIQLYPNPGIHTLYIKTASEKVNFEMYDITGKQIMQQNINGNTTINTSTLHPGMYFYRILQNGVVKENGKWIKQ
jgi:hypothetical protein